ncbi:hypothetical protein TNCT_392431 [Trichonephila clavata]|uniref:Uncharacterized protein n=1 Tax=Trichonephila clavata TaxID=2740835 RepID=A0A8X6FB44_TRICU|nr:hypothetical protein TNCT_392431 [Trichonephila clavata]
METSPTGKNIRFKYSNNIARGYYCLDKTYQIRSFPLDGRSLGNFHNGSGNASQRTRELLLDFYFNPDGTVDRVKTADLFVHSEEFDVQTRFVVACQYWSKSEVLAFLKNLHESAREQILHKYSTSNENLV